MTEQKSIDLLLSVVMNDQVDVELRREAVRAVAINQDAAQQLVTLAESGEMKQPLRTALLFFSAYWPLERFARPSRPIVSRAIHNRGRKLAGGRLDETIGRCRSR